MHRGRSVTTKAINMKFGKPVALSKEELRAQSERAIKEAIALAEGVTLASNILHVVQRS
jgi:hypothetical protein